MINVMFCFFMTVFSTTFAFFIGTDEPYGFAGASAAAGIWLINFINEVISLSKENS